MYSGHLGKVPVMVGRGCLWGKNQLLRPCGQCSPTLQTEHMLAAFVAQRAWLLFAQRRDAERMEGQRFLQSYLWFMEDP